MTILNNANENVEAILSRRNISLRLELLGILQLY